MVKVFTAFFVFQALGFAGQWYAAGQVVPAFFAALLSFVVTVVAIYSQKQGN